MQRFFILFQRTGTEILVFVLTGPKPFLLLIELVCAELDRWQESFLFRLQIAAWIEWQIVQFKSLLRVGPGSDRGVHRRTVPVRQVAFRWQGQLLVEVR